jgi:hypothetical protein
LLIWDNTYDPTSRINDMIAGGYASVGATNLLLSQYWERGVKVIVAAMIS